MNTSFKWGAWAAVLAGATLIFAEIVQFYFGSGNVAMMTTPDRIGSVGFFIGAILLVMASVTLYLHHAEQAGRFGFVAFLVALVGSTLMVASDWNELFAMPTLVSAGITEPTPDFIAGFLLNFFAYALGWLLFGIAAFRARVFPRSAALTLIVSVLVMLVSFFTEQALLGSISIMAWYASIAWMGIAALLSQQPVTTPTLVPAAS